LTRKSHVAFLAKELVGNAVVESFFSTRKDELEILDAVIRDPEQLFYDLWMRIEGYYNRKRRNSSIGYSTPVAFENRQAERDRESSLWRREACS
jgi:transposase InsO family protein